MPYKIFISLLLFAGTTWLFPEDNPTRNDIHGTVRDSKSGEALPFANISVKGTIRGATTNTDGYFVLVNEPIGPCSLLVSYIGYDKKTVGYLNRSGSRESIRIELDPTVLELEGVTVTAAAEMLDVSAKEVSQMTIAPAQLARLPNIGEVDVFRSIQLLPGVSGANDGESGLYVRGGTPDQNLVLFDGMTIYHVDHFFGFFSAFNADAIKDIQLYKGGFPAEYGGRISSVVNLTGKTGHQSKKQLGVGVNLLSGHANFEMPLGDWGSFLITGRRSYTDFIRSPLYNSIYELMTGEESLGPGGGVRQGGRGQGPMGNMQSAEFQPSFYFFDLNSKLTLTPSEKDILTLSFYTGKDDLDKSQDYTGMNLRFGGTDESATLLTTDFNRWGNLGLSGKWSRQWNSRLQTDILVAQSGYFSEYDRDRSMNTSFVMPGDSSGNRRGFSNSTSEDNTVDDLTGRFDLTWHVSGNHTIKAGTWLSFFDSQFQFTMNDTISMVDRKDSGALSAFYLQDKWRIGTTEWTFGARANHFSETNGEGWRLEPRISFAIPVPVTRGLTFKGAWGQYSQYVNRIVNENISEGSRDFWILADDQLKPSLSEHRILGLAYETRDYLFSVEGYQKSMKNLVEYTRRFNMRDGQSDFFFSGDGEAQGLEFLLQKKRGALTGWLGYTLGKVENTFPAFNYGEPYPADNDRRHELNGVAKYSLGVWTFAATTVYATGRAYTAPESQYALEMLDGEEVSYIHVSDKNGYRLPDYLRLDLSVSRQFESEFWRTEVGLSIFNATNHKNVWYREYNLDTTPVTITDATMLGFTPTFYVQVNLK